MLKLRLAIMKVRVEIKMRERSSNSPNGGNDIGAGSRTGFKATKNGSTIV